MNVAEIVAGLVGQGLREFVVCPGAHDAVLVEELVRLEEGGELRLWSHFDERSAGFFALGRTMAGRACAVVTTSGTAVAELLPAVVEAHYQRRPLVLVTADRPLRFRGSGAPQAIEQEGIFGGYVEGADEVVVAGGGNSNGQTPNSKGADRGVLDGWSGKGPWHVNVCLEEVVDGGSGTGNGGLSRSEAETAGGNPALHGERIDVRGLVGFLRDGIGRGLVVMIGQLEPEEREEVFHFVAELGAPVVAEATSGLREALGGLNLPDPERQLLARPPGKVLRLGGVPSGRFWRELESLPEVGVCSATPSGFAGLARESLVVKGAVDRILQGLGEVEPWGDVGDFQRESGSRRGKIDELLEAFPESEAGMVRTLSMFASLGSSLFLGNSLPIRQWNLFAQWQRPVPEVRANRGANGIDGQLGSWLGWSAEHEDAWAVVGDVTALHDAGAPAMLEQVETSGRVLVVINNAGGRIFERLPRLRGLSERTHALLRTRREARFESWARMWGMDWLRVDGADGFDALEPSERPLLLELVPDEEQTAAFWDAWNG